MSHRASCAHRRGFGRGLDHGGAMADLLLGGGAQCRGKVGRRGVWPVSAIPLCLCFRAAMMWAVLRPGLSPVPSCFGASSCGLKTWAKMNFSSSEVVFIGYSVSALRKWLKISLPSPFSPLWVIQTSNQIVGVERWWLPQAGLRVSHSPDT